eukprot:5855309-Amphidinium_carterae.1
MSKGEWRLFGENPFFCCLLGFVPQVMLWQNLAKAAVLVPTSAKSFKSTSNHFTTRPGQLLHLAYCNGSCMSLLVETVLLELVRSRRCLFGNPTSSMLC